MANFRDRPARRSGNAVHFAPMRTRLERFLPALAVAALVLACFGVPLGWSVWRSIRGLASGAGSSGDGSVIGLNSGLLLILRTGLTVGGIGVLSTLAAWPAAWWLRNRGPKAWAFAAVPLLMPSYLAYAGLGLLRAPGTWLGDRLAAASAQESPRWTMAASYAQAVLGLALWAWPLAAIIVGLRLRRLEAGVLDALRLEPCGRLGRARAIAGMTRGSTLAGIGLVALVMAGSAVPLHLAQLDTYAIRLWLLLDLVPRSELWRVWVQAWPLGVVATACGVLVASRLGTSGGPMDAEAEEPVSDARHRRWAGWAGGLAGLVWTTSVLVPLALFAINLESWSSVGVLWHARGREIVGSVAVAACIGAIVGLIGVGTAHALQARSRVCRRLAAASAGLLVLGGLLPGVLVGSMLAGTVAAFGPLGAMGDSPLILVMGHVARFGFVGALLGWWLTATEGRPLPELRALDGVEGWVAWVRSGLAPQWAVVAAGMLAAGLLSLSEVETAVVLQPPGLDAFARQMLEMLHYARREDLCAAAVLLMGGGLVVALLAAGLASLRPGRALPTRARE